MRNDVGDGVGGGGGVGRDVNRIKTHVSLFIWSILQLLLEVFCTENITKKRWPITEQASNKTVAKNSWRYLFANPEGCITNSVILADLSDLIGSLARTIKKY